MAPPMRVGATLRPSNQLRATAGMGSVCFGDGDGLQEEGGHEIGDPEGDRKEEG